MAVLKMMTVEWPNLHAEFDTTIWIVTQGRGKSTQELARSTTLKAAYEDALELLAEEGATDEDGEDGDGTEQETGEAEEEDSEEDEGRSVVKRRYKRAYKPFKAKCGDELSILITRHVASTEKDEDGRVRTDPAKLKRFAIANDCWMPEYASLNVGMQRMNVANRLRAKVKKGYDIVWAK